MSEICDRCGNEVPVTWYVRGPVKGELLCIACKPQQKTAQSKIGAEIERDLANAVRYGRIFDEVLNSILPKLD